MLSPQIHEKLNKKYIAGLEEQVGKIRGKERSHSLDQFRQALGVCCDHLDAALDREALYPHYSLALKLYRALDSAQNQVLQAATKYPSSNKKRQVLLPFHLFHLFMLQSPSAQTTFSFMEEQRSIVKDFVDRFSALESYAVDRIYLEVLLDERDSSGKWEEGRLFIPDWMGDSNDVLGYHVFNIYLDSCGACEKDHYFIEQLTAAALSLESVRMIYSHCQNYRLQVIAQQAEGLPFEETAIAASAIKFEREFGI